jgi:ABC-type transporter Mla subunit MlaD
MLLALILALLAFLVWLTVTGRLGKSRHGYAAIAALKGSV